MRHLLMDPRFPDVVGEWAARDADGSHNFDRCANDNGTDEVGDLSDPLLLLFARLDVEANRAW